VKALVVYEGNTEKVAQAICSGLKQGGVDAACKSVGAVTPADLANTEYWILGGPSNGFLAGRKITGLLKKSLGTNSKAAGVFFDTRMAGAPSGTSEKLAALMKGANMNVASWTYFSTGPNKELLPGEETMAVVYGRNLVNSLK
jgi:flavorubredoxin